MLEGYVLLIFDMYVMVSRFNFIYIIISFQMTVKIYEKYYFNKAGSGNICVLNNLKQ